MPRANNRKTKVSEENEISHKCAGTDSIQTGNNNLYGQHGSPVLSSEMGSKKSQESVTIIKKIYDYLLLHKITITAEYLPRVLNGEADRESRDLKNSKKWKLD